MATSKKAATSKKECTIVAVYKFKTNKKLNGTRCTLVRNGEGKEYKVWTHATGCASSCDCEGFQKWHKKCYHIKIVEAREAALKPVVATPATPVAPVVKKEVLMIVEPTTPKLPELTDEDLAAMLATCDTPDEPTTAQPIVIVATPAPNTTKAATPATARKKSSIEASVPTWMLTGRSGNGTFAGRGTRKAS